MSQPIPDEYFFRYGLVSFQRDQLAAENAQLKQQLTAQTADLQTRKQAAEADPPMAE